MLPTASFITWVEDATQAPLRSLCAVIPPQALTAAAPHLRRTARRRALTAGSTDEDDSGAEDPLAAADYAEHFAAASAFAAVIYGFNVGAALEHITALVCTPSAGGQLARRSVRGSDCDSNRECAKGLRCFQRNKNGVSGSAAVPGCAVGGSGDLFGIDYCYKPAH